MKTFTHRYAVTDRQWAIIAPLLPGKATDCGVTAKDNRFFSTP
ncbi:transposase [Hymenobacter nivis]|jgi:transposase|nr:transposase [Hymenobacter nivis]